MFSLGTTLNITSAMRTQIMRLASAMSRTTNPMTQFPVRSPVLRVFDADSAQTREKCQRCCRTFCTSSLRHASGTSKTGNVDIPETSGNQAEDLLSGSITTSSLTETADFPSDVHRYKNEMAKRRSQSKHRLHLKVNPQETSILLFPGQGSQFVGMGRELLTYPNVEDMYAAASDILGYDLLNLCLNGPIEKLSRTVYCQPAILVTSLAAVEKLKHLRPWAIEHCITAAGFSVGEIAALVFAGSLSFEDAVHLVKVRATAMQEASEATPSGMMTVFLSHRSKLKFACFTAKRYCAERMNIDRPVCEVSSYLYPECKVIAGNIEALDFIETNAKEFGLLRTKRLPVSGAFHTSLMAPASKTLLKELKKVDIASPLIPVHANVNSYKYRTPAIIEKQLVEQVHSPVKWEQTMHVLYARPQGEEYPFTYELGPGKQLGAILGKVNSKARTQYEAVQV